MGVTHRYQPFPKPESTTTVDEMNAKLQARLKGAKVTGSVAQRSEHPPVERKVEGSTPSGTANSSVEQRSARVAHNHEVAGSNPATAKPLEWEKPKSKDATGVYTTCKRYSCAKVTVNGKTSYELFKLAPGGGWFRSLNAGLDNFLQVQKLAQIDADKGAP